MRALAVQCGLVAASCFLVPLCALNYGFTSSFDVNPKDKTQQSLWEHRNLGKAFFENPDTHVQAVGELKSAFDISGSVRDRINYALGLLRAGQTDAAVKQLTEAQKLDPTIPHSWFNLGITYKRAGDYESAIVQLKGMIKLRPDEAIAHYNLAAVYRAQSKLEDAVPEFLAAERLNPDLAGPHFQLFSTYQRLGKKEEALKERQLFEEVKKRQEGAAIAEDMESSFYSELYDPPEPRPSASTESAAQYDSRTVSSGWDFPSTHMALIDAKGVGSSDLLIWSKDKVQLLEHAVTVSKTSGLDGISGVLSIAVGDYDNDGMADLCIVTASGATLYKNNKGSFTKTVELPNTAGVTKALWLDYDHDYDLDLLLFGPKPVLVRNNGNSTFEDKTSAFPFVKGTTLDAASTALRGETAARDVVATYADRPAVLYTDRLNGKFEASDLPDIEAGAQFIEATDYDHDGLIDLITPAATLHNKGGSFVAVPRARGDRVATIRASTNSARREDLVIISKDGSVDILSRKSVENDRWITVRIVGVKNIKSGQDATVEMKSGAYYEKRIYHGSPLAFAIDGRADVDAIRITWPNGLIQNEAHQKIDALTIPEAQRLSGSCPMIFTWDGEEYRFITDVLGVAPLGASSGDGNYFPVDNDEYIQIPGDALKAKNGKYSVHITEELHEVLYLDQVQLIAVDHPAKEAIYTNDKFKSPPYPEFRLFSSAQKLHPVHATDAGGVEAASSLQTIDHKYPHAFKHNTSGVADLHTLDLDFGRVATSNKAALVLNGWVDWADGSTFLGASQNGQGLIFPYLQVKDEHGDWKTVVQDMGIPSGKPKTMVVDLTGKFLSSSREVRIVTNLCVYWDEIFLIDDSRVPQVQLSSLNASAADVHFRGFSEAVIDASRQQPEQFLYNKVHSTSSWNPTRGNYTRYGNVHSLVQAADDKMVIMGSGDELSLEFPANLPAPKAGWTRDFLLLVDGWAKDADANTAFSENVLPLPFHSMSGYPYKASEHFPSDLDHAEYLKNFLTRPALRLIRPLVNHAE